MTFLRRTLGSALFCVCLTALAACGDDDTAPSTDLGAPIDGGNIDGGGMTIDGGGMTIDGGGMTIDGGGMTIDGGGVTVDAGAAVCGDRMVTAPEQCDDGNTMSGDGCSALCAREIPAGCGDGTIDRAAGEGCDDGNTTNGDGCSSTCSVEAPAGCGNGTLDIAAGEECDDGGLLPGDGCDAACQLEAVGRFCGNGTMDPGEVCDDGNTANGDGCNPTCNLRGVTELYAGMASTTIPARADGVGTAARFALGGTLAVDNGVLWLVEAGNCMAMPVVPAVLRRIDIATAAVTTIANVRGSEGIATDGLGHVWVAGSNCTSAPGIDAIDTTGAGPAVVTTLVSSTMCASAACFADGAPGTATIAEVRGLTWFAGDLYIVDPQAAVIRRLDVVTGAITTIAGSAFATSTTPVDGVGAVARFESPRYIVSDNSGLLYVSDTNGAAMRTVDARTGAVTTFAGNGTGGYVDGTGGRTGTARIHRPRGVTADGASVYWVEADAHTVRQGIMASLDVSTLAGTAAMGTPGGYVEGTGTAARFATPFSIAYHAPSNSLFVFDVANHVLRRIR